MLQPNISMTDILDNRWSSRHYEKWRPRVWPLIFISHNVELLNSLSEMSPSRRFKESHPTLTLPHLIYGWCLETIVDAIRQYLDNTHFFIPFLGVLDTITETLTTLETSLSQSNAKIDGNYQAKSTVGLRLRTGRVAEKNIKKIRTKSRLFLNLTYHYFLYLGDVYL